MTKLTQKRKRAKRLCPICKLLPAVQPVQDEAHGLVKICLGCLMEGLASGHVQSNPEAA